MPVSRRDAIAGSLLGTAVGDALGLPYEGLTPARARRLLGPPERHRLLPGRGLLSDDTEQTCLVALALAESKGEVEAFTRRFGCRLRTWFLLLPAAMGLATLRACLKLTLGFSPAASGVCSAGNGSAMRCAILGAAVDDLGLLARLAEASCRVTHTDPRAVRGTLAVALAAWFSCRSEQVTPAGYAKLLEQVGGCPAPELDALLGRTIASVEAGQDTLDFADSMGLSQGVTGFVCHTVPVALHAWLRHPESYREALGTILGCGGDTDTTAAITGGVVGARTGMQGIPEAWLGGLSDWPRTTRWLETVADALAAASSDAAPVPVPRLPVAGLLLRNAFFLSVILAHAARRAAPPY